MKPAIVAVAYDRPGSLDRLLLSLLKAEYQYDDILLVISIDNSGNDACRQVAEKFRWPFGEKKIIMHDERMGLKKHILSCGELTGDYDSIIMLEDDLGVASDFYNYACEALEFTKDDDRVGGISLYAHQFDVFRRVPFEPVEDGFDNWYMQFASSWGQAWTHSQWKGFRSWLDKNDGKDLHGKDIPEQAAEWNEKSWLKYAIKYLCETDRYFLYPRVSRTTNYADAGEHMKKVITDLQVPLSGKLRRRLVFSRIKESSAVYDAFFDNRIIKTDGLIYSFEPLPYRLVRTYGLMLRPWEMNVINDVPGEGIYAYDSSVADKKKSAAGSYVSYFFKGLNIRKIGEYVRNIWSI